MNIRAPTHLRARRGLLARVPLRSDDAHELVSTRKLAPLRAHLQQCGTAQGYARRRLVSRLGGRAEGEAGEGEAGEGEAGEG